MNRSLIILVGMLVGLSLETRAFMTAATFRGLGNNPDVLTCLSINTPISNCDGMLDADTSVTGYVRGQKVFETTTTPSEIRRAKIGTLEYDTLMAFLKVELQTSTEFAEAIAHPDIILGLVLFNFAPNPRDLRIADPADGQVPNQVIAVERRMSQADGISPPSFATPVAIRIGEKFIASIPIDASWDPALDWTAAYTANGPSGGSSHGGGPSGR